MESKGWEEIPEPNEGKYQAEHASNTLTCKSHRLRVPGGWIVRTITYGYKIGAAGSQVFISDPTHEWDLPNKQSTQPVPRRSGPGRETTIAG